MTTDRKQKLIDLGADALAEALLELAVRSDGADDLVERLIATPQENLVRFKNELASLKHSRRFVDWRGASRFAEELEMLLQDLKDSVTEPIEGVELVAAFYETDESIFKCCDDSSGHVGEVFTHDAKELFVEYARSCTDKEKIAAIILKLNRKDNYGVRRALIDCAGKCLPVAVVRTMIATLQQWADREKSESGRRSHLMLIESLARQIKDAKLFEKTRIASWGTLSTAAFIDIARVYLASGDVEAAYSWLIKIPEGDIFKANERDQLLMYIFRKQGDNEKLAEVLYQRFRSLHSVENLNALLDVVGEDQREAVISGEVALILENPALCESDAHFLTEIGKIDQAEEYLLGRADHLNGNISAYLLGLADVMESENRCLAASLVYRSLLDSVLESGYTKSYPHGIRYLKKLDKLAVNVADWKTFNNHSAYKKQIQKAHGRKRSYWSKYGERR